MTELALVDRPSDAERGEPGTQFVVLDAAWTPPRARPSPSGRPAARPVRPVIQSVIDDVDVVEASLALLDGWAAEAHLPEAFALGEVSWWYQARMLLRWDVHELVLWQLVLDRLLGDAPAAVLRVPAERARLVAAARARAVAAGGPGAARVVVAGGGSVRSRVARGRQLGARVARGIGRWRPATWSRTATLERRLANLARDRGGVVALAWPRAYQVVRRASGELRGDPYLARPLEHVAASESRVITVGLGMDHARDDDWAQIEAAPSLLPERFLAERGGPRAAVANLGFLRAATPTSDASPARAIASAAATPAMLGAVDLGPALARLVAPYGGRWLNRQRHVVRAAASTLDLLQPNAVFTDREASRTSWITAARRQGIRTVAVQHGMIYPGSPEYIPGARGRARPDVTCVFGEYERDILVSGGYPADAVVVTGSPRPADDGPRDPRERADVRRELGVADEDRLLLVSVAHNEIMGELHTFGALERVLGGPLDGIHVVIKLHPQDHAPPRHEAFLKDLAAGGGYAPPRISLVRDVDLYRLLRTADAHLGQYSTVLSDAVVAGTPNMIIVGAARADTLGYVDAGVATPVRTVDELRAFMANPVALDPEARSRFLARHFRPGDGAARVASVLLAGVGGQPARSVA